MERHARYYTTKPRDDAGAAAPFGTTRQEVLGSDRYLSQFFFFFFFIVRTVSGRDVVEVSLQVGEGEESALPSLFKKEKKKTPSFMCPFPHNSTGLSLGLCFTIQNEALIYNNGTLGCLCTLVR